MSSSVDWLAVAKQALTTVWARSPLLNACVPVRKQDAVASSIEVHSIPIGFDEHSSDVDPVDQARYNLSQVARAAEDTVAEVLRTGLTQRVRVVGPHDDVLVRLHRGWGGGHTPPLVFIGLRAPKKSSLADVAHGIGARVRFRGIFFLPATRCLRAVRWFPACRAARRNAGNELRDRGSHFLRSPCSVLRSLLSGGLVSPIDLWPGLRARCVSRRLDPARSCRRRSISGLHP